MQKEYLTEEDYPLLVAAGFTSPFTGMILWKGNVQVTINEYPTPLDFNEHSSEGSRGINYQLTREEFGQRYG